MARALILCGVVLVLAGCRGAGERAGPAPSTASTANTAAATPAMDLETEFRRCIEEWREESRWAEFIGAYAKDPRWSVLPQDPQERTEFLALWDDMNSLAFDTFFPWLILARARLVGDSAQDARREFIEQWQKEFPAIHAKRIRVVITITKKVWKAENANMLEKLEREFPAEELTEE